MNKLSLRNLKFISNACLAILIGCVIGTGDLYVWALNRMLD